MLKLYRYEIDVTKEMTATDTSLVRATGVTVNVYRQGATAQGAGTSTSPITVHDLGSISRDNLVIKAGAVQSNSNSVTVNGVPTTASIVWDSEVGTFEWTDGQRIIVTSPTPVIYSDDQGAEVIASSTTTTDANGVAVFYAREKVLDIELINGTDIQLLVDVVGSGGTNEVTLEDFGAIADGTTNCSPAFDDAIAYLVSRSGGVIKLGIGTYALDSVVATSVSFNLTIQGKGRGLSTLLVTHAGIGLQFAGTNRANFKVKDLSINGSASTTSLIDIGNSITGCTIEDVQFASAYTGTIGVDDQGADTQYEKIRFTGDYANCILLDGAVRPHINNVVVRSYTILTAAIKLQSTTSNARISRIDIQPALYTSAGGTCVHILGTSDDIKISDSIFIGGTVTNGAPAIVIEAGTNITLSHLSCVKSTIGISITGGSKITIIGAYIDTTMTHGIDITSTASNVHIVETTISNVGGSTANTSSYVNLASGTDDVSINGLNISTAAVTGKYAVSIGAAGFASDRIQVTGVRGVVGAVGTDWFNNAGNSRSVDISHNLDDGKSRSYVHTATTSLEGVGGSIGTLTLSGDEVTADVTNINVILMANANATSFADMTNPADGQEITIVATVGAKTTIVDTGNIQLATAADFVMTNIGDAIKFKYIKTTIAKWVELSRSTNA